MKTISQEEFLMERINSLQIQQNTELKNLKIQFHEALQSLNPLKIITESLSENESAPNIKSAVVNGVVNLTSQFLSKNTLYGIFQQPINKILHKVVHFVANKFSSQ